MSKVLVTKVWSQDPAIKYGGGWAQENRTLPDGSVDMFMLGNYVAGATYSFKGIGLSIFGSIATYSGLGTNTTYTIDQSSPSVYSIDPSQPKQDNVLFYKSPPLQDSQHSLAINNLHGDSWLWFNFLEVTSAIPPPASQATSTPTPQGTSLSQQVPTSMPSDPKATSSSVIGSASNTPLPSAGPPPPFSTPSGAVSPPQATFPSSVLSEAPSSTASAPEQALSKSTSQSFSTASIAGVAVAGCILLLLIGVIVFLIGRRRRTNLGVEYSSTRKGYYADQNLPSPHSSLTPFQLPLPSRSYVSTASTPFEQTSKPLIGTADPSPWALSGREDEVDQRSQSVPSSRSASTRSMQQPKPEDLMVMHPKQERERDRHLDDVMSLAAMTAPPPYHSTTLR